MNVSLPPPPGPAPATPTEPTAQWPTVPPKPPSVT